MPDLMLSCLRHNIQMSLLILLNFEFLIGSSTCSIAGPAQNRSDVFFVLIVGPAFGPQESCCLVIV